MEPQTRLSPGSIMTTAGRDLQDSHPELGEAMRRIAELEALNEELAATSWNYMEVLGFVAHELKNALASAVLSLYTVKDGYLGAISPAREKSLESVARSLEDLKDMIRNYLDLSRLEKGEMEFARTHFTINSRVVEPEQLLGTVLRLLGN